jgi:hypothetical protein
VYLKKFHGDTVDNLDAIIHNTDGYRVFDGLQYQLQTTEYSSHKGRGNFTTIRQMIQKEALSQQGLSLTECCKKLHDIVTSTSYGIDWIVSI